jgi:hypothetical protein
MKLICDSDDWYQETHMKLWWRPCLDLAESALGGSLESGGRFCVCAFSRNLASVAMMTISHIIYFIKTIVLFYFECDLQI